MGEGNQVEARLPIAQRTVTEKRPFESSNLAGPFFPQFLGPNRPDWRFSPWKFRCACLKLFTPPYAAIHNYAKLEQRF
jgi:hypothetical protein